MQRRSHQAGSVDGILVIVDAVAREQREEDAEHIPDARASRRCPITLRPGGPTGMA